MNISLPYPPSINNYWRMGNGRIYLKREGDTYRDLVGWAAIQHGIKKPLTGRLSVTIKVFPPDARARDLDNIQKPILDALQHARAFKNDSQIDRLLTTRETICKGGKVHVIIEEIG